MVVAVAFIQKNHMNLGHGNIMAVIARPLTGKSPFPTLNATGSEACRPWSWRLHGLQGVGESF